MKENILDLKRYTNESQYESDIVFMEDKNTGYKVVAKRAILAGGINEINAYRLMSDSPLIDFSIGGEGVMLLLHRHSGKTLKDLLKNPRSAARLAEHLDRVLDSALVSLNRIHSAGIWHGGIRPGRIIIDEDDSVRYVGFGNSSMLDNCMANCIEIGKCDGYTAPEVAMGGNIDGRLADLYSLGKSLLEIVNITDCLDFDAIHKIREMSSVIPERREIFLNTLTGKL